MVPMEPTDGESRRVVRGGSRAGDRTQPGADLEQEPAVEGRRARSRSTSAAVGAASGLWTALRGPTWAGGRPEERGCRSGPVALGPPRHRCRPAHDGEDLWRVLGGRSHGRCSLTKSTYHEAGSRPLARIHRNRLAPMRGRQAQKPSSTSRTLRSIDARLYDLHCGMRSVAAVEEALPAIAEEIRRNGLGTLTIAELLG